MISRNRRAHVSQVMHSDRENSGKGEIGEEAGPVNEVLIWI